MKTIRLLFVLGVVSVLMADAIGAAPSGDAETRVDVNQASAEALMTVPGIGKSLAQRIVEFRKENGPFETVDDLLKVRGIGEKSLQKMRPHVRAEKKSRSR